MRFEVEAHGAGALLGGHIVDHGEFVRGVLVDDREGAFAVGGEGVVGARIERVGVDAVADRGGWR